MAEHDASFATYVLMLTLAADPQLQAASEPSLPPLVCATQQGASLAVGLSLSGLPGSLLPRRGGGGRAREP